MTTGVATLVWIDAALRPRLAALLLALALAAFAGDAAAQPRVELRIGIAGTPVAEAWNPLAVVVRDAPGATLRLTVDAGGLDLGAVPQRLEALVAPAGGIQRLDLDLPLPSWRRITWRVEQDGRVLASGGLGARDRDARRLDLLLSAEPARWSERLGPNARPLVVAASDLPRRAAGWDGVGRLIVDGTTAPPAPEVLVTAAASGVLVLLPSRAPGGYDAVTRLVQDGAVQVGAGRLAPLPDRPSSGAIESAPDLRPSVRTALADAVPVPAWRHLAAWTVLALAVGFAVAVFLLLQLGGLSGGASAALLVTAALLASPFAAPPEPRPTRDDALTVVAGGIGLRYAHRVLASLPAGETPLDGVLAAVETRPLRWSVGRTVVDLAAGERIAFDVAPRIVGVPDDVRSAAPGVAADAPDGIRQIVPAGGSLVRTVDGWWLVLDPGGAS